MRLVWILAIAVAFSGTFRTAQADTLSEWDWSKAPAPHVSLPQIDPATKARLATLRRYALVIGNGSGYRSQAALPKVDQNAASMAAMLQHLGFKVYGKINATSEEMDRLIEGFVAVAARDKGATTLFYYGGHGVQARGRQFLVPIDMRPGGDETKVSHTAFSLDYALAELKKVEGPRIVIADACRENPFVQAATMVSETARVGSVPGSLIAFASGPGRNAYVGDDRFPHTVYTEHLLKAMGVPYRSIDSVLKDANVAVYQSTKGEQEPEYNYGLRQDYPLVPRACSEPEEQALWAEATRKDDAAAYRDLARRCPDGLYTAAARRVAVALSAAPLAQAVRPDPPPPVQAAAVTASAPHGVQQGSELDFIAYGVHQGDAPMPRGIQPGSESDFIANVGDRIFYDYGEKVLRPDAKATLDKQVAWLKHWPTRMIRIEGHSDARGNRLLSLKRADERATMVEDYLVAQGVSSSRILSKSSFGKERPVALGTDEAASSQNRRVVTIVVDPSMLPLGR